MKILIIGKVWPEPNSSAAGKRMLQLIELFQELGEIHFYATASKTGFESDLSHISVTEKQIELNNDQFDEDVKYLNPSIVVFDRFMTEEQFGWRVVENCPNALRILNTEDLHFLRKARGEALKRKRETRWLSGQSENEEESENQSETRWLSGEKESEVNFDNNDTMRELAAIYRCDLSLLVSEVEIELLQNTFHIPAHLLYYLPIFSTGVASALPKFEERKGIIFIGNFLHEPNVDAVKWIQCEIWPKIHSLRKELEMHIYGAYPSQQIKELNNEKSKFFVHGRAMDASSVTKQARLSLSPLRFGAGIKGKLIEAMECGTPSITTAIGSEGMADEINWPGEICTTSDDFVESTLKLYDSKELWEEKQQNGFRLLDGRFNKKNYSHDFLNTIQKLSSDLKNHRNISFTGKIFLHQTLMSTKYLSKWIMEKNQKK